jgi:Mce-associated membrane protein
VTDPAAPTSSSAGKRSVPQTIAVVVAAVWAVAVLVAAGWFGAQWALADTHTADTRDSALDGARQAAINLNSINPDDVAGSVGLMESSTTGDMHDQIEKTADQITELAGQSKARLEATVLSSALTELDTEGHAAKALVVVAQTSTYPNEQPTKQRVTWTLDMLETDGVWKASQATTMGQPVALDDPNSEPAPVPAPVPVPATEPAPAPAEQGGP